MARRLVWTCHAKIGLRGIVQQTALQILKTLARNALTGEGNFFRDKGAYLDVARVLDRKKLTGS